MNEEHKKEEIAETEEIISADAKFSDEVELGDRTASVAKPNDKFLPASILIAAVMISGSVLYALGGGGRTAGTPPAPSAGDNVDPTVAQAALLELRPRDTILGDPNAPVTLIEYGDYQCPFCGRFFAQTEPLIKEAYVKTNKVRMIYRELAFLGPESVETAKAAECAKDQSKFWAYHDAIFTAEIKDGAENNGNLNKELFVKIATDLKMNIGDFTSCLDANKYADEVTAVTDAARAGGINATPMTFVDKELVQGAQPFAVFKAAIDKALEAQ